MLEKKFDGMSADELTAQISIEVERVAKIAGLDSSKFGEEHQEIIGRIAAFLTADAAVDNSVAKASEGWLSRLGWGKRDQEEKQRRGPRGVQWEAG